MQKSTKYNLIKFSCQTLKSKNLVTFWMSLLGWCFWNQFFSSNAVDTFLLYLCICVFEYFMYILYFCMTWMCTWLSNWLFRNAGETWLSKVQGLPKPLVSLPSQRITLRPPKSYFHRSKMTFGDTAAMQWNQILRNITNSNLLEMGCKTVLVQN